jgi:hypothetical protein
MGEPGYQDQHFDVCGKNTGRQCGMKLRKCRGCFWSSVVVFGDEK